MENIIQNSPKQLSYYEIIEALLSDDDLLYNEIKDVMGDIPMTVRKIRNRILRKYSIQRTVTQKDIQRLGSKISIILRDKGYKLDPKNKRTTHQALYIPKYKRYNNEDNGNKDKKYIGDIYVKKVQR